MVLATLMLVTGVFAYGQGMMGAQWAGSGWMGSRQGWYGNTNMHDVMTTGTYEEFQTYREQYPGMMPWIDSEEEFTALRTRTQALEESRWSGQSYGCPMMGYW